jgi:hypothetical protein
MMNKKTLALLLLIAFGISLGCAIKYYPRQGRLPSSALQEPRRSTRSEKRKTGPTSEQSSSSKEENRRYAGYDTDLFRPLFDNPPPKPETESPALPLKEPPVPLPPLPLEPIEPPASRKLARFTYLGQVAEGEKRSVFLKKKDRIFVVKTGDDFGEKREFRLAQVTDKEIRIATGESEDLIRIPLQKKKPLKVGAETPPRIKTAGPELPRLPQESLSHREKGKSPRPLGGLSRRSYGAKAEEG